MELILNLVWFGLACCLAIMYAVRWQRPCKGVGTSRRAFLAGFVAVVLLAAIALPVISLTDDLQGMNAVAESDQAFRPAAHDGTMVADVNSTVGSVGLLQGLPEAFAERLPNAWEAPPAIDQVERAPAQQRPPPVA